LNLQENKHEIVLIYKIHIRLMNNEKRENLQRITTSNNC